MNLFLKLYNKSRNLILYGMIGSFTAFLDFCVFSLLVRVLGVYYLVANCISVLVGITTSFLLNRAYNFKVKDKTIRRFAIFLMVGLFGLCLSNFILWLGINIAKKEEIVVKLISVFIVALVQFILNKCVTFKKKD